MNAISRAEFDSKMEQEQLSRLDKYQKRYLKNKVCAWCEAPLDQSGCNSLIFGSLDSRCPEDARIKRRADCLSKYKPRVGRRGKRFIV
jgi:hypothetical protein